MEDLSDLIKALEDVKTRQKSLTEAEAEIKEQLMKVMLANGIDKQETDYGSIRIQRRIEKDYGPKLRSMEIELKEAKKLADDMGDYKVMSVKESLVFTPSKVPF